MMKEAREGTPTTFAKKCPESAPLLAGSGIVANDDDENCAYFRRPFRRCRGAGRQNCAKARFCWYKTRHYYKFLLLLLIAGLFVSYLLFIFSSDTTMSITDMSIFSADIMTENAGCILPKLDPWHPTIRVYLRTRPSRIKCKRLQPELTYLHGENQRLYLNASELAASGYKLANLRCEYRTFDKTPNDDFYVRYQEWKTLENGTFIPVEMVQVQCKLSNKNNTVIYANAHVQILAVERERVNPALAADSDANRSPAANPNSESRSSLSSNNKQMKRMFLDRPNIVLFVIDSMSHSAFRRDLPRFLDALNRTYKSFIFDGLVKVGLNSFPNAMAFLTGRTLKIDRPDLNELPSDYKNQHYDDWPLIFKEYHKHGYATYFAEDFVNFQLFTFNRRGFLNKPTDHYFRPYLLHLRHQDLKALGKKWTNHCFGNNIRQNLQLAYFEQFLRKYLNDSVAAAPEEPPRRRRPIFALNWLSDLSHDISMIDYSDNDFASLFERNAPLLKEDSFVFVFGDHGHRFSAIRQTYIGRVEEQMPFFSMHVPPRLLERFPNLSATIQTNTKRLSTWWDLHVTLKEILDLGRTDRWENLASPSQPVARYRDEYGTLRGYSLLRDLPHDRTCESADIPREYCVCDRETPIDVNSSEARDAARALVAHVNALLRNSTDKCATLTLKNIRSAQTFSHNEQLVREKHSIVPHYRLAITVAPSDALFEGTLIRYNRDLKPKKSGLIDGYEVMGQVSRINMYGTQSDCVDSVILKLYCYCKNKLSKAAKSLKK